MVLFFKKKKQPETIKLPEFPSYEPQLPLFEPKPFASAEMPQEEFEFEMPLRKKTFEKIPQVERPLFVRIEKYKSAVKSIDEIKAKIMEAEKILKNLNKMKSEEEEEIRIWQEDIQDIKTRLLEIDKMLFEI